MKFTHYIYIAWLFFGSCYPNSYTLQSHNNKVIEIKSQVDSTIISIIEPYKNNINDEMEEVLTYTKYNLEKGRPQSTMGNFVTDLCLDYAKADMCVMNNGGLRTTISKGKITKGKLYELMPFENELVVLELNKNEYIALLNYIKHRGGEPFSGITITMNKNGDIVNNSWPVNFENKEKVRVLTSDYLANGGDAMSFFQKKKQQKTGIKLRDAIIDYCRKTDTINVQLDKRIIIVNE